MPPVSSLSIISTFVILLIGPALWCGHIWYRRRKFEALNRALPRRNRQRALSVFNSLRVLLVYSFLALLLLLPILFFGYELNKSYQIWTRGTVFEGEVLSSEIYKTKGSKPRTFYHTKVKFYDASETIRSYYLKGKFVEGDKIKIYWNTRYPKDINSNHPHDWNDFYLSLGLSIMLLIIALFICAPFVNYLRLGKYREQVGIVEASNHVRIRNGLVNYVFINVKDPRSQKELTVEAEIGDVYRKLEPGDKIRVFFSEKSRFIGVPARVKNALVANQQNL